MPKDGPRIGKSAGHMALLEAYLARRGEAVKAGRAAADLCITQKDAHRAFTLLVRLGRARKLAHGLYASAAMLSANRGRRPGSGGGCCENMSYAGGKSGDLARALRTVRRRILHILAVPRTLDEVQAMAPGELTPIVLERLIAEEEVVEQRSPEGRLFRQSGFRTRSLRLSQRRQALVAGLPAYPLVSRLSRMAEKFGGNDTGTQAEKGRLKRHLTAAASAGEIEIVRTVRRDWIVRRAASVTGNVATAAASSLTSTMTAGETGGGDPGGCLPAETAGDAFGVCAPVLRVLRPRGGRLPEATLGTLGRRAGMTLASNCGVVRRMLRAGLLVGRRDDGRTFYSLSREGQRAAQWIEEASTPAESEPGESNAAAPLRDRALPAVDALRRDAKNDVAASTAMPLCLETVSRRR